MREARTITIPSGTRFRNHSAQFNELVGFICIGLFEVECVCALKAISFAPRFRNARIAASATNMSSLSRIRYIIRRTQPFAFELASLGERPRLVERRALEYGATSTNSTLLEMGSRTIIAVFVSGPGRLHRLSDDHDASSEGATINSS